MKVSSEKGVRCGREGGEGGREGGEGQINYV